MSQVCGRNVQIPKMIWIVSLAAVLTMSAGLGIPDDMKEMAQGLHDNCLAESGVNEALIPPCLKGDFANDPKLKCYMKCIFESMGAITEDGKLDADAFSSILPEEMGDLLKSVSSCKGVSGTDACDLAFNFNVCIQKADPKSYLLI